MKIAQNIRDSGIQWIGSIPFDWDVIPIKRFGKLVTGMTPPTDNPLNYELDTDFPWIRPEDINELGVETVATKTLSKVGWECSREIQAPASLICCIGTIGKVGYIHKNSATNQQITALQSKYPARFLYYALQAARKELEVSATGNVVWILNSERLGAIKLPRAPEISAVKIANFLDKETQKIDKLIQKQEKLIKLLGEKRRTVISEAVTRGIGVSSKLMESGIPWLGKIPENWHLCPFKSAVKFQEGPGIMAEDFKESGIPLLRISCIKDRYTTLDGCKYLDPEKVAKKWAHFRVHLGDLLISASATMGTVSEVTQETVGAIPYTGIIRLFPGTGILKEFLTLFVVSDLFLTQIDLLKTGSAMQHFGPHHLNQMKIVLPPLDVQKEILSKVNPLLSHIDILKSKAEEAIELMKEHRASLISAAVTGKIDVRELA